MLPTLFQYGDVFPTETEYWLEGGDLFLRSSSNLSFANDQNLIKDYQNKQKKSWINCSP